MENKIIEITNNSQQIEKCFKDRENDIDNWDYGCECIDEIEVADNGLGYELFGENVFYNYSIHYTAKELSRVEFIQKVG